MKRRFRHTRRHRNARPGQFLTFDPEPWFEVITEALETERRPMMLRAFEDALMVIRAHAKRYPPGAPPQRVSSEDRDLLLMFLVGLCKAGYAPPDWPQHERGKYRLRLRVVTVPRVKISGREASQ
jgi:hypothetical protein